MREKVEKLVIAFHTTADAMKMENECRRAGLGERLIPVPREITAGCGMAWCADPSDREKLELLMRDSGIDCQEERVCLILK